MEEITVDDRLRIVARKMFTEDFKALHATLEKINLPVSHELLMQMIYTKVLNDSEIEISRGVGKNDSCVDFLTSKELREVSMTMYLLKEFIQNMPLKTRQSMTNVDVNLAIINVVNKTKKQTVDLSDYLCKYVNTKAIIKNYNKSLKPSSRNTKSVNFTVYSKDAYRLNSSCEVSDKFDRLILRYKNALDEYFFNLNKLSINKTLQINILNEINKNLFCSNLFADASYEMFNIVNHEHTNALSETMLRLNIRKLEVFNNAIADKKNNFPTYPDIFNFAKRVGSKCRESFISITGVPPETTTGFADTILLIELYKKYDEEAMVINTENKENSL